MNEGRACRGCGVAERVVNGVSNLTTHTAYCQTCIKIAAMRFRAEERRR